MSSNTIRLIVDSVDFNFTEPLNSSLIADLILILERPQFNYQFVEQQQSWFYKGVQGFILTCNSIIVPKGTPLFQILRNFSSVVNGQYFVDSTKLGVYVARKSV